ncbi:MAG TPA: hypothetical protein VFR94_17140 [Nitrososphaeraceae archaeon]|nr:hypothetical protein [Nitrososphaeraceae archaeon]
MTGKQIPPKTEAKVQGRMYYGTAPNDRCSKAVDATVVNLNSLVLAGLIQALKDLGVRM